MILSVRCDKDSFKTVTFQPGFNVILAERTKESTKKDTRNGLGKTTLIEIIHFCLGAKVSKGKGLVREPLLGWTFSLDIELRGREYTIKRNTDKHTRVLLEGDFSFWPLQPNRDTRTHETFMEVREWNKVLGWLMFDLPLEVYEEKYTPTFRSIISYFIRRGRDAFSTPFEHHRKQLEWDKQVNNAFMLGLNWEQAQQWQILKDQENALSQLKNAAKSGIIRDILGTIGDLETQLVRLDEKATHQQEQLLSFRVHPQYHDIEIRANNLTEEIHKLTNENVADRRLLEFYESSFHEEQPASQNNVSKLYKEAGVVLGDLVVKRLQDVLEFHKRVVANRKSFLETELNSIKDNIFDRDAQILLYSDERASLLSILQTHGALDEYTKLQRLHMETVSQLEEIKRRINNLKIFEKGKSALHIDREQLLLSARADYEERRSAIPVLFKAP